MTETHKVYLGAELEVRDKRRAAASPPPSTQVATPPRLNMEDPGFLRAVDLTHFYCGTNRKVKRGMIHRKMKLSLRFSAPDESIRAS